MSTTNKQRRRQARSTSPNSTVPTAPMESAGGTSVTRAKTGLDALHPDNWDFGWVTEANLQSVIEWEYFREAHPEPCLPPARQLPVSHELFKPVKQNRRTLHIVADEKRALDCLRYITPKRNRFLMCIDFRAGGVNQLVKEFETWARKMHKHRTGTSRKHGRAASVPWQRLRQLAAKRLHDQGLSHEKAQRLILGQKAKTGQDSPVDVLPNYASAGGWHDAIKAARKFIEGDSDARGWVDRVGRRRWWEIVGNAARVARAILDTGHRLLLPNPTRRIPGAATKWHQCALWLQGKIPETRRITRSTNISISEPTSGGIKLKSVNQKLTR